MAGFDIPGFDPPPSILTSSKQFCDGDKNVTCSVCHSIALCGTAEGLIAGFQNWLEAVAIEDKYHGGNTTASDDDCSSKSSTATTASTSCSGEGGDADKRSVLTKLLELYTNAAKLLSHESKICAQLLENVGEVLLALQRPDEAISAITRALAIAIDVEDGLTCSSATSRLERANEAADALAEGAPLATADTDLLHHSTRRDFFGSARNASPLSGCEGTLLGQSAELEAAAALGIERCGWMHAYDRTKYEEVYGDYIGSIPPFKSFRGGTAPSASNERSSGGGNNSQGLEKGSQSGKPGNPHGTGTGTGTGTGSVLVQEIDLCVCPSGEPGNVFWCEVRRYTPRTGGVVSQYTWCC